jgi:3-methyl-2-oxobutanoate hydroxymethyltransferase
MTIAALQQMKRDGRKIVGVVAWDFQIARIADRAGVDIISAGDSVGVNLWGHTDAAEITLDEMIIVCKAVRRGTRRALVNCDLPAGVLQAGVDGIVQAAMRIVSEGGADIVKLDGEADFAADFPDTVNAITRAGIPVFAQFEINPNAVENAKQLEAAGASLLDFKHSGPVAGPAVVAAVSIPVLGGLGGGPWLDGRLRMAHAAIGYAAGNLDSTTDSYANVARITLDALTAYARDVRAGRHITPKGSRELSPG